MSGAPVITIEGVTKAFGDREVLKGIDLEIAEHEAVAVIGASGSGKSTLLRCVDLLIEIDDGDVYLDGEVVTDPSADPVAVRRKLGFVFQAYNLFPHLNVIDNVTLGISRAHGLDKEEARERALAMLARFGLEGRENESPSNLSGGQQQRVAIARAFATRPRAMLLDEITSARSVGLRCSWSSTVSSSRHSCGDIVFIASGRFSTRWPTPASSVRVRHSMRVSLFRPCRRAGRGRAMLAADPAAPRHRGDATSSCVGPKNS